jgi:hypothetical protein
VDPVSPWGTPVSYPEGLVVQKADSSCRPKVVIKREKYGNRTNGWLHLEFVTKGNEGRSKGISEPHSLFSIGLPVWHRALSFDVPGKGRACVLYIHMCSIQFINGWDFFS